MSDQTAGELLAQNALIDAQQVAENLGRTFVDADIPQYHEYGINLQLGAEVFVHQYQGTNSFIGTLKGRLKAYRKLTSAQARAALNIMQQELGVVVTASEGGIKCFGCEESFPTWDMLMQHKRDMHGSRQVAPPVIAEQGEAKAVIANTTATKGLDLSNLPDGRYAAPDTSGNNEYIFIMVKRVRKTKKRDRRFEAAGRIITGNEVAVAGTIEVKIWSSDSKELVGEQKPGDVYRGDLESELELVLMMPEQLAILFGKISEHCCICGKRLTDDDSRRIGMGLDCEKKQLYFQKPPEYTYVGQDRPDKEAVDPNDEKYLAGILRRYVEPPEVKPQLVTGGR